ncbi:hypothetical protein KUTeg_012044 [Tegillarca granosa]|uniref:Transposase n=1 Tax=Tegillarca granosa TaxID=220873 RepID=A0ABQ9EYE2_TEGGR|nr:hypothetical protein KUTeg_012044 [Tegillarca granosa]
MRLEKPEIIHRFDVWHMAKVDMKKLSNSSQSENLVQRGKVKGCEIISLWSMSIINHLYWCAARSNGDGELVEQKWTSILNHFTNVHEGHGN